MGFTQSIQSGFNNYANFAGRAVRSQFWYWVLFVWLASIIVGVVQAEVIGGRILGNLFSLAVLVPGIAVAARRLHDTGKSGWWQLIALTVIGIPVLIFWYCMPGDTGPNRFGTNIYQAPQVDSFTTPAGATD